MTEKSRSLTTGAASFFLHRQGMILLMLDAVCVPLAFLIAYYTRFHLLHPLIPMRADSIPLITEYAQGAMLLLIIWIFLTWRSGGYNIDIRNTSGPLLQLFALIENGVYAMAGLMTASFLYRELLLSRIVYLLAAPLICILMLLMRIIMRRQETRLALSGVAARKVVVVGTDSQALEFVDRKRKENYPIRILGFLRWEDEENGHDTFVGFPVLGHVEKLEKIHAALEFDNLILSAKGQAWAQEQDKSEAIMQMINFCERKSINLYMLPASFNIAVSHDEVGSFSGMPVMRLRDASTHQLYSVLKRIFDIVVSLAVLTVGSPLWLLIALLVRRTSPGGALYTQERVGLHGKTFKMYKFRSMVENADSKLGEMVDFENIAEPVFNIRNDPRVTPIGCFLRRSSIDEIPQLINVLRGEMSLIGPRPERVELVEKYDAWQRRRLKVKPGITGYQQIVSRGDPSLAKRIELDLFYLKHQGILLDFYIILKTIQVIIRGDGMN